MTTINQPTCDGGNFQPLTLIRAEEMNDELDTIKNDLIYISSAMQTMADKLDTVDEGAGVTPTSDELITLINAGTLVIDASRIASDISSSSDVAIAIANHRITTNSSYMHPETSIKSTELVYSTTPSTFVSSPSNLLDEIKNIRYQIHKLLGKTTWVDTPTETLTHISSALDVVEAKLATIETNAKDDQNAQEIVALINASGYLIDDNNIASTIARDSEVTAAINAHVAAANPHAVTKTTVGLTNVLNVQQFPAANVETGTGTNGLTTYVPSSYTMNKVIRAAFGEGGNPVWLYAQDTSSEGGQINFATANSSSYPNQISIDRMGDILRLYSIRGAYAKIVEIPQLKYSGNTITTYMMSVPEMGNHATIANEYWSGGAASYVQNNITGPLMILGGTVCKSNDYGYVQWSTNGYTWYNFSVASMASAPSTMNSNPVGIGAIPCVYVTGTLYLKAGSTYTGASTKQYGGSYQISYFRM